MERVTAPEALIAINLDGIDTNLKNLCVIDFSIEFLLGLVD